VRRADGSPDYFVSVVEDVQRRKESEAALKASEERFRIAAETANDVVYEWDLKQSLLWPEKIDEMLAYEPGGFPRTLDGWAASVHPEDIESTKAAIQAHLEGRARYDVEYRVRRKDGVYRWWTARGAVTRAPDGTPIRWIGSVTDVTERKREIHRAAAMLELSVSADNVDGKTMLQEGLDKLQSLTDSRIGFLHFVSDDQKEIELVTWSTDTLAHYCHAAFDSHYPVSSAGIWADSIRLKQPIVVNDYAAARGKRGLPEGHSVLRRFISVPIFENNLVRMIVGMGNSGTEYRERDVETVTLIGNELYRSVQRKRAETEIHRLNRTLEQRVQERTEQLAAANKELDAFAYSASHDLRAPLQTIDGFARALEEDFGGKLDAEARDYLQRVRAASQRMAQLVDDLLRLSRLTRADMTHVPVDLSALARTVAGELLARDPARDVVVEIAEGVLAQGDRNLLRVLLENLLSNAWKFTSKHARARIEFSVLEREGETVYCLRDDGAGFDMRHAGKLFTPFQRLHPASEFPGNGVGLATVQRIVRRHGGRVWAEGEPGKGAAFFFTIPDAPADTPDAA
jgi:PAS domain S-box-containing protein